MVSDDIRIRVGLGGAVTLAPVEDWGLQAERPKMPFEQGATVLRKN